MRTVENVELDILRFGMYAMDFEGARRFAKEILGMPRRELEIYSSMYGIFPQTFKWFAKEVLGTTEEGFGRMREKMCHDKVEIRNWGKRMVTGLQLVLAAYGRKFEREFPTPAGKNVYVVSFEDAFFVPHDPTWTDDGYVSLSVQGVHVFAHGPFGQMNFHFSDSLVAKCPEKCSFRELMEEIVDGICNQVRWYPYVYVGNFIPEDEIEVLKIFSLIWPSESSPAHRFTRFGKGKRRHLTPDEKNLVDTVSRHPVIETYEDDDGKVLYFPSDQPVPIVSVAKENGEYVLVGRNGNTYKRWILAEKLAGRPE